MHIRIEINHGLEQGEVTHGLKQLGSVENPNPGSVVGEIDGEGAPQLADAEVGVDLHGPARWRQASRGPWRSPAAPKGEASSPVREPPGGQPRRQSTPRLRYDPGMTVAGAMTQSSGGGGRPAAEKTWVQEGCRFGVV